LKFPPSIYLSVSGMNKEILTKEVCSMCLFVFDVKLLGMIHQSNDDIDYIWVSTMNT